jgi:hypothetical protein
MGSLADVNTAPAAFKSHCTLLSTQLVRAPKRSPRVALAIDVVTHLAGEKMQSKWLISER